MSLKMEAVGAAKCDFCNRMRPIRKVLQITDTEKPTVKTVCFFCISDMAIAMDRIKAADAPKGGGE